MKTLCLLLALAIGMSVIGCHQTSQEAMTEGYLLRASGDNGVSDSDIQRQRRIDAINNLNKRMLVDDWDAFWLYERTSRLTYYSALITNR